MPLQLALKSELVQQQKKISPKVIPFGGLRERENTIQTLIVFGWIYISPQPAAAASRIAQMPESFLRGWLKIYYVPWDGRTIFQFFGGYFLLFRRASLNFWCHPQPLPLLLFFFHWISQPKSLKNGKENHKIVVVNLMSWIITVVMGVSMFGPAWLVPSQYRGRQSGIP